MQKTEMTVRWRQDWQPYIEQYCAPLSDLFGTDFGLVATGGGCMALQALMESGACLMISDAYDILSPMGLRRQRWRNDREILGFRVGYYDDESDTDAVCFVTFAKARDAHAVAIAIRVCLVLAAKVKAGKAAKGTDLEI